MLLLIKSWYGMVVCGILVFWLWLVLGSCQILEQFYNLMEEVDGVQTEEVMLRTGQFRQK